MRPVWLTLACVQLLACVSWSAAQTAAPATPTFKTQALNVLVDVVVTGKKGVPVAGLSQNSFKVLQDGHPQKIVAFEEHPLATAAAASPSLPPGVYTNAPTFTDDMPPDVLLIDSLNTPTHDQQQVHRALLGYLKTLPEKKPIAIFTLQTELRQILDFTTDHTALLNAVDEYTNAHSSPLLKTSKDKQTQLKDEDDLRSLAAAAMKPGMAAVMVQNLRQFNSSQDSFAIDLRAQYTLAAFDELARYLSGMSGRKNLIWLSGSFPLTVLYDPKLKSPFDNVRDFSEQMSRTAKLLADARVAVYPLDARGLFPQQLQDPSMSGGTITRTPDEAMDSESEQFRQNAQERLTLDKIAHETGGEVIANSNDLKGALDEVDRSGGHYYTLVYAPPDQAPDNKTHKIEVRLDPDKYQLSYRRTYSFSPPSEQRDRSFLFLMQHDVPASTQLLFRLSPQRLGPQPVNASLAGDNVRAPRPLTRYNLTYDVDVTPFLLNPGPDGVLHDMATLVVIAYDRDGKALNSVANSLNVNVPPAQMAMFHKSGLHYQQVLDIPARAAWLRAGVYDHNSGRVGSFELPLAPEPSSH